MSMTLVAPTDQQAVRSARRGLGLYLGIVVLLSVPLQLGMITTQALEGGAAVLWVLGLMAVPALASIIARLRFREGFSDVSFRFNGRRGWIGVGFAVALPIVVGAISYGFAWITGLAQLSVPSLEPWFASIVANLVVSLILVPGEEIGWRGYMLTRLIAAGVPHAVLVSGVIWGLWHLPLVLWGGYVSGSPSPLLSAGLLMISATSMGYVLGLLRLHTGSIWPPIVLHVVWNTVIQAVFDPATSGADHALWVGEAGIVTSTVLIMVAVWAHARRSIDPALGATRT